MPGPGIQGEVELLGGLFERYRSNRRRSRQKDPIEEQTDVVRSAVTARSEEQTRSEAIENGASETSASVASCRRG